MHPFDAFMCILDYQINKEAHVSRRMLVTMKCALWRFDRFMATHARQVPPPVKKRRRNSMPHVARIEPRANSPRHRRHSAGQAPKRSARTMTSRWLPRAPRWVAGAKGGRLPDFTAREARLVVR